MTGTDRAALKRRLLSAIESEGDGLRDDDRFNDLALAVFRHQFEQNSIYRRYSEARGATPASVDHWLAIPAVPTDAFKAAPLFCGDPDQAGGFFETSGTTQGTATRGRHYFRDSDLYDAALTRWFPPHLLPDDEGLPILTLVPPRSEAPHSSLSHMVDTVVGRWAPGRAWQGLTNDQLDLTVVAEAVDRATADRLPLLVIGTSFAFVHLHDRLSAAGRTLRCPPGSRAMDTGGFKGKSRAVPRDVLYRMIGTSLGITEPWIINEYGMTEMSSQFYDGVAGVAAPIEQRRQHGPGWVRSVAVDPENLAPRRDGEIGILRHIDLANLDSVAALQTSDLGRITPEGIELHGRATGAEARGCSIAVDDLLDAAGRRRSQTLEGQQDGGEGT